MFNGSEGRKPCLPPRQLDQPTIRDFGRLSEPLAHLRVVQAQLPIHRAAYIGFSPLRMFDQGVTLDPQGERAPIRLVLASLLWLEAS